MKIILFYLLLCWLNYRAVANTSKCKLNITHLFYLN